MNYAIFMLRRAQRELAALPRPAFDRATAAIAALAATPRPSGCTKLTARDGWRIRVGDYRILYDIDDAKQTVTILHIGHRRDVYR
jgi:mRNA interferase RelE/StbE